MEAVEKDDQLLRHLLRITKNHGNIIKGKSTKQLKKIIKTYLMAVWTLSGPWYLEKKFMDKTLSVSTDQFSLPILYITLNSSF